MSQPPTSTQAVHAVPGGRLPRAPDDARDHPSGSASAKEGSAGIGSGVDTGQQ